MTADVSHVTGYDICKAAGISRREVDVVIGGPPCQGFSLMGKRRMDDPRNLLLKEFARIVAEIRPDYWVMENVAGLTMGPARDLFSSFLSRMRRFGYSIVLPVRILDSYDFGVPQNRRRVFVLGFRPSAEPPSYEIAGVRHLLGREKRPTVWDAIGDLFELEKREELLSEDIYEGKLGCTSEYSTALKSEGRPFEEGEAEEPMNGLSGCRRSHHTAETVRRFAKTRPGEYEPISRFYRLEKSGVSHVLRAGTGRAYGGFTAPRPIHPITPRCITVREAARLHSFPDWFQFDSTIWHGFRQIGNSVPPLLARGVGTMVMTAIAGRRPRSIQRRD